MRRRIIKCWFMAIWTRLRVVARHFRRSSRASASCVRSWPSVTLIYSSSHPPPSRPSSSSSLSSSGQPEVCCLWKLVANLGLSSLSCVVQTFVRLDAAGKLSKRERNREWSSPRSPKIALGSPGIPTSVRLCRDLHINEPAPSGDRRRTSKHDG